MLKVLMVEDNLVLLVQRIIQNSLDEYFETTVGEDCTGLSKDIVWFFCVCSMLAKLLN